MLYCDKYGVLVVSMMQKKNKHLLEKWSQLRPSCVFEKESF